jgi:hypothetical protein
MFAFVPPWRTRSNPMDGMDVWDALHTKGPSPRHEILYTPVIPGAVSLNPEDCVTWGQSCGGALRVDDYKIIVGCRLRVMSTSIRKWVD